MKPNDEEIGFKNSIKNLLSQLGEIEDLLDNKLLVTEGTPHVNNVTLPVGNNNNNFKRGYVPVHKWDIYFSGDPGDKNGLGVNAFIERVEELRLSRGVSEEELKNSITDLLRRCTNLTSFN